LFNAAITKVWATDPSNSTRHLNYNSILGLPLSASKRSALWWGEPAVWLDHRRCSGLIFPPRVPRPAFWKTQRLTRYNQSKSETIKIDCVEAV